MHKQILLLLKLSILTLGSSPGSDKIAARAGKPCWTVRDCKYWDGEYCYQYKCWPKWVLGCEPNCPRSDSNLATTGYGIRPCYNDWGCPWYSKCFFGKCYMSTYYNSGLSQPLDSNPGPPRYGVRPCYSHWGCPWGTRCIYGKCR